MKSLYLSLTALTVVVLACTQTVLGATTYYVTTDGTGDGSSWASPTNSIQGAIDAIAAGAGNTVWVSNGVYEVGGVTNYPAGTVLTNRIAITKAMTLRSLNGPAVTTIKGAWDPATNGPAAVRCVYMTNGSLIGFTLTNGATLALNQPTSGTNENHYGGGVWCPSTTPMISNCVVTGNSAAKSSGGLYQGTLYNCTVSGNSAGVGGYGGVAPFPTAGGAYGSTMYNCLVTGNRAGYAGGGVYAGVYYNCQLSGNKANIAGGSWYGTFYNCTIVSNSALGAAASGGGVYSVNSLYNSILYFNICAGAMAAPSLRVSGCGEGG